MAKKAKKDSYQGDPGDEHVEKVVVETPPVVEQPKVRERLKPSKEWEIKDRIYYLKGNKRPLSRMIKSANIFYFRSFNHWFFHNNRFFNYRFFYYSFFFLYQNLYITF